MALPTGTHSLGPDNASLQVRTYREGVAAKAGHDLIIDVTRWDARVEVADEPVGWTIELNADPRSLEIREGLRGVKSLTDKDRVEIRKNIDEKVLGSDPIQFRSSGVRPADDGGRLTVDGELAMAGSTRPLTARLKRGGGRSGQRHDAGYAERLGDQALPRADGCAEGPRRGRGRDRGQPRLELTQAA